MKDEHKNRLRKQAVTLRDSINMDELPINLWSKGETQRYYKNCHRIQFSHEWVDQTYSYLIP